MPKSAKEMTDREIRTRILRLGFRRDEKLLQSFIKKLKAGLPSGTGVALRGSVVTNQRHEDKRPFDANGQNTSDLDVTLIGKKVMEQWKEDKGFYIPRLHTKPLSDADPDIAPALNPLRVSLQKLVQRPVSFQATSDFVLFARDVLFDQPYYILIEPVKDS